MGRFVTLPLVLLFSVLALAGGPNRVTLCLHEAGPLKLAPGNDEASACADDEGMCQSESIHECEWCVDVELDGLDLAQSRFNDTGEVFVAPPLAASVIPAEQWGFFQALRSPNAFAQAPPVKREALIVAETAVLLL